MNSKNIWVINIPKKIAKKIAKFPKNDQLKIIDALQCLEADPWTGDIIKIQGELNLWRRRIGNYRIFFALYLDAKIVYILNIERRTSSTY